MAQRVSYPRSVSGKLAPTVEVGGWLIVGENEKYLLLNAGKFDQEKWFGNGIEVAATGEIKPGTVTIYQEGVPFEARTLRPIENSANVNQFTTVTVTGDARVTAQPDTAIISVSVVTQNRLALEAQQQNASQTTAVINALKRAAGSGAEIKTSGYALVPQRVYKEGQPPTITSYEARNSISVTLSDLTKVGAAIDAATEAGANNIDGVSFTLRRDRTARGRALAEATREAIGKANTLAQTLGGRVVRVVAVQEGGTNLPRPVIYAQQESFAKVGAADTPIEVGTLEINSQVQLTAEIEIGANPR
ncbi:MAG: SIMPL domain-containing protein [Pyrinomonadaceae bacterium]